VDPIDHASPHRVNPVLVEADENAGHRPVFRDQVAAQEEVVQRALAHALGSPRFGKVLVEKRLDLDAAFVVGPLGQAADHVCRREALDPLDRVHPLDLLAHLTDELEALGREQPFRPERDEERPLAAELLPETFVGLVDGIVFRDPHADVVVDLGEVEERREADEADDDQRAQRVSPTEDEIRQPGAHRTFSSWRREKSSSLRPTL
jgi:hypothetical protein